MGSVLGREEIFVPFLLLYLKHYVTLALDCLILSFHLFLEIFFIPLLLLSVSHSSLHCFVLSLFHICPLASSSLFPAMVKISELEHSSKDEQGVCLKGLCASPGRLTSQVESSLMLGGKLKMAECSCACMWYFGNHDISIFPVGRFSTLKVLREEEGAQGWEKTIINNWDMRRNHRLA